MSYGDRRDASLIDALIPVSGLVVMLTGSLILYGEDSSYGGNQIALILATGIALLVGRKNGYSWHDLEKAAAQGIANTFGAILILLMVGALIGTWILSGTVPAMIYYGLKVINPDIFYVTACILCSIASLSIGSSWSVAGTVGVGLMGISAGLGLSTEITAGAIISGAYFGDKMSPLSDTTNLAPAVAGTDLFTHIRHMIWTTGPAIAIALVLYLIIGFSGTVEVDQVDLGNRLDLLEQNFNISIYLLLPMVAVFAMALKRYPAFPSLMVGALLGCLFAMIFQGEAILKFVGAAGEGEIISYIDGVWRAMFGGYVSNTGDAEMDKLLSRGGMSNMTNTVWLIICAITFGSVLEKLGMLKRIVAGALSLVQSTGGLVFTTALTCIGINLVAGDQYMAIVLPGRMYIVEYKKRGLAPQNLSRTLEDTATVTSVLVPWNTCGAYISGVLGIATLAYAPYCFFNIISPIMTMLYGYYNVKIARLEDEELEEAPAQ